jgi:ABC-type multidrug transport system fused ATPase/permease subunit
MFFHMNKTIQDRLIVGERPAASAGIRRSGEGLDPDTMPASLVGFITRISLPHQLGLAGLSVLVFLLATVPLELQRRIVNDAFEGGDYAAILVLALTYAGLACGEGLIKLGMNLYRSWVSENAVLTLRRTFDVLLHRIDSTRDDPKALGVETAMMLSEAEPIGGFVGVSLSEPLLQGGILAAVFGYMVWLQPSMALLALAVFSPQLVIVPIIQQAINRRVSLRILTLRAVSVAIISDPSGLTPAGAARDVRIETIFRLNMGIYTLKFSMNFIMNLLHHLGTAGILAVGGWYVVNGQAEIGTVVAFVSGLAKINDPWRDLVNWFRDLMVTQTKYGMISGAVQVLTKPDADDRGLAAPDTG